MRTIKITIAVSISQMVVESDGTFSNGEINKICRLLGRKMRQKKAVEYHEKHFSHVDEDKVEEVITKRKEEAKEDITEDELEVENEETSDEQESNENESDDQITEVNEDERDEEEGTSDDADSGATNRGT